LLLLSLLLIRTAFSFASGLSKPAPKTKTHINAWKALLCSTALVQYEYEYEYEYAYEYARYINDTLLMDYYTKKVAFRDVEFHSHEPEGTGQSMYDVWIRIADNSERQRISPSL
jgi:hypothetical protein